MPLSLSNNATDKSPTPIKHRLSNLTKPQCQATAVDTVFRLDNFWILLQIHQAQTAETCLLAGKSKNPQPAVAASHLLSAQQLRIPETHRCSLSYHSCCNADSSVRFQSGPVL